MDYVLFVLDSEGIVKTFQHGEELGYTADEIEGQSFSKIYTKDARKQEPLVDDLKTIKSGERFKTEKVIIRKDGSEFEAQINVEPMEHDGEIDSYIVIMNDKNDTESLDEFSGLVAHELRNSLSTAQGYLEMARSTHKEQDFNEVQRAQKNMIETITDVILITKGSEVEKEDINLKPVFEEAYRYSNYEETSYDVEDATIKAGKSSLMRLLGNLISNSVEHNDGKVHIEVGLLEDDKGFFYQDNGKGILEENREEALKRGYSTSDKEDGQGLGLYLMKQLADLNGWNVKLTESETGGARFEIYIE
jgi:PAS domain S-box-containing protein